MNVPEATKSADVISEPKKVKTPPRKESADHNQSVKEEQPVKLLKDAEVQIESIRLPEITKPKPVEPVPPPVKVVYETCSIMQFSLNVKSEESVEK